MEHVLAALKRVWYSPERPAEIRARPASSVGLVMARAKCNLGLALLWSGLGHMSDVHPTKVVGRSALGIVTEQLRETPRGSFIRFQDGPAIYPRELMGLGVFALFGIASGWWVLYAIGVVPLGLDDLIRLHVVDVLRHHHEIRTLRQQAARA